MNMKVNVLIKIMAKRVSFYQLLLVNNKAEYTVLEEKEKVDKMNASKFKKFFVRRMQNSGNHNM